MEDNNSPLDTPSLEMGDSKPSHGTPAMGEVGNTGLVVLGGNILEECQGELRGKQAIVTYNKMMKDPSIAAALQYVDDRLAAAEWRVVIPEGYKDDPDLKKKAEFIRQVKEDMEHDWRTFILQAGSCGRYGFAPVEKVFRYRRKDRGSKYDDGLIGLKKLVIRGQDTVEMWKFNKLNREVTGFYQQVSTDQSSSEGWGYVEQTSSTLKFIPRNKFLLFRHNPLKNSPIGTSPLSSVWSSWKLKQAYQESEAISTAQDATAFKLLFLPPEYLVEDAPEDKKQAFQMYQQMLINAHQAKQSGMILPFVRDDQGNKMFDFEVKSISGTKSYDINTIITRYNQEILLGLFADVLALGQSGGGSFSLASSKMSIIELAVKSRLDVIRSQLNHDLIPQLFELNGWDTTVTPLFEYESANQHTIDDVSKFVQRIAAVGMLPRVPAVVNWIMHSAGIDYSVSDDATPEELDAILTSFSSRAGDSYEQGLPGGTGDNVGGAGDSGVGSSEASSGQPTILTETLEWKEPTGEENGS